MCLVIILKNEVNYKTCLFVSCLASLIEIMTIAEIFIT